MRILQTIETGGPGGAERFLISLCRVLATAKHEVLVVLLKHGWLEAELVKNGIAVSTLVLRKPIDREFLKDFRNTITHFAPDVVHSHEFTMSFYARLVLGVPQVATAHGANFCRGFKRRLLALALLRPNARFRLIAVSQALARRVAHEAWVPGGEVDVVHNGIELPPALVHAPRLPGDPLRLVAVGNLYPVKNHALLIEGLALLRRRGVNAQLDILGHGAEQERLQQLIEARNVREWVRLRGFVQDVRPHLADAHVFVSASLYEGLPLSFLEAMAAGIPVVSSRVGGVEELLSSSQDGLLFESGSVKGLVNIVERLDRDEALRQGVGAKGRAIVDRGFSMTLCSARYLEWYRRVAGDRVAPG